MFAGTPDLGHGGVDLLDIAGAMGGLQLGEGGLDGALDFIYATSLRKSKQVCFSLSFRGSLVGGTLVAVLLDREQPTIWLRAVALDALPRAT